MKKYNEERKTYEPYTIPDDWHCPLETMDMHEAVNCARCGKIIEFGDGYISMQIYNDYGCGYTVCSECHEKEWQERRKHEREKMS